MNKELSLKHLFRQPSQIGGAAKLPLLLLLHGYGSNEADLMSFATYFADNFFVAAARAPYNLSWGGHAWFDINWNASGGRNFVNSEQAEASRLTLLQFVDEIVAQHDLDANRVFLAGFSQGAIMSYSAALTTPEKFAGIVAMSGALPYQQLPIADAARLKDFPILITHGVNDPVLPIQSGRQARDFLQKLPIKLDYREYADAHNISEASLRDVVQWLGEKVKR